MPKRRGPRSNKPRGRSHRPHGDIGSVLRDPRLLGALGRFDAQGFTWEAVQDDILPVFERARPFSFKVDPPVLTVLPPGVTVGFGVDAGPAFMRVSTTHLDGWPVDLGVVAERALANLGDRTHEADRDDVRLGRIETIEVDLFQSGDGWASTTVLLPDALERLFGPEAALFVAPWRDLLVRLPVDVDLAFATWLAQELESEDPNALCLEAFEWSGGRVRCRPLLRDAVAV